MNGNGARAAAEEKKNDVWEMIYSKMREKECELTVYRFILGSEIFQFNSPRVYIYTVVLHLRLFAQSITI